MRLIFFLDLACNTNKLTRLLLRALASAYRFTRRRADSHDTTSHHLHRFTRSGISPCTLAAPRLLPMTHLMNYMQYKSKKHMQI